MIPKFRGRSQMVVSDLINSGIEYKGNGWVEGYLIEQGNDSYIINGVIEANSEYISIAEWVPVFPESISQATGVIDQEGTEFYNGDIAFDDHTEATGVVHFKRGAFMYRSENVSYYLGEVGNNVHIIGNIYENPELLEEQS